MKYYVKIKPNNERAKKEILSQFVLEKILHENKGFEVKKITDLHWEIDTADDNALINEIKMDFYEKFTGLGEITIEKII